MIHRWRLRVRAAKTETRFLWYAGRTEEPLAHVALAALKLVPHALHVEQVVGLLAVLRKPIVGESGGGVSGHHGAVATACT